MGFVMETPSDQDDFQMIPHRSSDSLNELLKKDYDKSLAFKFNDVMEQLDDSSFDFLSHEPDNIEIREAHNKFIEYLKYRLGAAIDNSEELSLDVMKRKLESEQFGFLKEEEQKSELSREVHRRFMKHLKNITTPKKE